MKTTITIIRVATAVTLAKWLRPATILLALLVALLGVTGCERHH